MQNIVRTGPHLDMQTLLVWSKAVIRFVSTVCSGFINCERCRFISLLGFCLGEVKLACFCSVHINSRGGSASVAHDVKEMMV